MARQSAHTRLSAWLLLVAYLPLLVASVVHTHAGAEAVVCEDCAHHVAHPSHLADASASARECLVCQWLGVPAMPTAALTLTVLAVAAHRRKVAVVQRAATRRRGSISLRAPPPGWH